VFDLSNGTVFSDLERSSARF